MNRLVDRLATTPLAVALVAMGITLLLAVPLVTMAPEGTASQEPDGPAFAARDVVDQRLDPAIATAFMVIEAPEGNVLAPDVLRELHRRGQDLRSDADLGPLLVTVPSPGLDTQVAGLHTVADVVHTALEQAGGLQAASDAAVVAATTTVVEELGPGTLGLSTESGPDADGTWSAPAVATAVLLDNAALGGGSGGVQVGADDTAREEVLREVRDVLRGGQAGEAVEREDAGALVAHAIAADVNLTAAEQGQKAGPYIGITVLLTLLVVGLVFRSTWTVAVGGAGLAALMIWLGGIANLVGLKQDQILSTVVPIAMVSFGVDFAFHALGRVREEAAPSRSPRRALAAGLAGVMGALVLALASDTAAFLANTTSGIEAIVQLGIAASIGLVSAFVLLGLVLPTLLTWIEERVPAPTPDRMSTAVRIAGATGAAAMAMTTVLLTVFIDPVLGVVAFVVQVVTTLVVPVWMASRRPADVVAARARSADLHDGRLGRWVGSLVVATARRAAIVLPVAAIVTAVAVVAALRVETRFDVEDFFSADTDFVVALQALDRHVGATGGEPLAILVTGDLADPDVVARLGAEVDALVAGAAGTGFAVDDDGRVQVAGGLVDLLRHATTDAAATAQVARATGTPPSDSDGDGLPDTRGQVDAIVSVALDQGLAGATGGLAWAPSQAVEVIDRGADDATVLRLELPGSREVAAIQDARAMLDPRVEVLAEDLARVDPAATAVLTGAPIVRQVALDAVSRALLVSLPIAVLACLLVAAGLLRSLRHAVVAIVPILLVVAWLYGAMQGLGFAINLVTGTIGAISIGIGIDFAVHLVARFREEVGRCDGDRMAAMRATGEGTGVALVASATSSVIGFLVLAFAPMPLFASYGLLTAMMIAMALTATLLVLPGLLMLATPAPTTSTASSAMPSATHHPHDPTGGKPSPPRAGVGT